MEKTDASSTEKQFESDTWLFFYLEMLVYNWIICKPYQQSNEVNRLILIFTVPSNSFAKKVIRVTWPTASYSNTGQVRHALSDWYNQWWDSYKSSETGTC